MIAPNRMRAGVLLTAGMLLLALAVTLLKAAPRADSNVADAARGLLFGLAIGIALVAVLSGRRGRSGACLGMLLTLSALSGASTARPTAVGVEPRSGFFTTSDG